MTYQVCVESCNSGDYYDAMESKLAQMTFWAHKKVLFDKIAKKIEEQEGKRLEKIAELLVQASKTERNDEKEADTKREELSKNLKDLLKE